MCGRSLWFLHQTTALSQFGKDVLSTAVAGFPGMILFGGKHNYCDRFVFGEHPLL